MPARAELRLNTRNAMQTGSEVPSRVPIQLRQGRARRQRKQPTTSSKGWRKENFLSWDRPLQGSVVLNFRIPAGKPLFDVGEGVLDDISIYSRLFYQSGRRYTPYTFQGYESSTGRPIFVADVLHPLSGVGKDFVTLDLNIEKTVRIGSAKLVLSVEISNVLDRKNVQIIDPVTGDAYDYSAKYTLPNGQVVKGPTPNSWNDPRYPELQAPVDPYPYNPARYAEPRMFRVGLSLQF
jgi:hypothetical protein